MAAINATLIWVGALVIILGVVALFMFAYVQAVMLAGMKRQDKVTRRDDLAGRAMEGILANPFQAEAMLRYCEEPLNMIPELIANFAYEQADAMIEAGDR